MVQQHRGHVFSGMLVSTTHNINSNSAGLFVCWFVYCFVCWFVCFVCSAHGKTASYSPGLMARLLYRYIRVSILDPLLLPSVLAGCLAGRYFAEALTDMAEAKNETVVPFGQSATMANATQLYATQFCATQRN
jgi:hypothetical protein